MTPKREETLKEVRAALEREPRLKWREHPIQISYNEIDQTVTLEGEAPDVAAKKLALEITVAVPGVRGIVDRLRVAPSAPMTDDEIRAHIRDAFLQEPALQNCAVRVRTREKEETFNDPMEKRGEIVIIVDD